MIKSRKIKLLKWLAGISVILLMLGISAVTVFAAGDVSSAIESTWNSAQTQIKKCCKQCCLSCGRYDSCHTFLC